MVIQFIDRKNELRTLTNILDSKQAALVVLYGRRRVGKTRLVREFLNNKPSLYFYIQNAEEKTILSELSKVVESEFFPGFSFTSFSAFLQYLTKKSTEGVIIAIDEFQRLTNIDGAISQLQRVWDEKLSITPAYFILSGSSIGAIRKVALSGNAPLYGRRTATLDLEPLKFLDLFEWFPNCPAEELVKFYASFGGTPAYLEHVDKKLTVEENIIQKILNKNSALHDEPEMLLLEEIRTPQRYLDILTAIAQGRSTLSEIANSTGLNRESSIVYLRTLEILDLIQRITPVTEQDAKKGLYHMKDQFFHFWFRFVRPNKTQIELELERNLWNSLNEDFNCYLGHVFEDICTEVLVDMARNGALPINVDKIGRWWWKDIEIDLLGLEAKSGKALAIEAKWSHVDYWEAKRYLFELNAKMQHVQEAKQVIVGLMAKQIDEKERLRREGFFIWDLTGIADKTSHVDNRAH